MHKTIIPSMARPKLPAPAFLVATTKVLGSSTMPRSKPSP